MERSLSHSFVVAKHDTGSGVVVVVMGPASGGLVNGLLGAEVAVVSVTATGLAVLVDSCSGVVDAGDVGASVPDVAVGVSVLEVSPLSSHDVMTIQNKSITAVCFIVTS